MPRHDIFTPLSADTETVFETRRSPYECDDYIYQQNNEQQIVSEDLSSDINNSYADAVFQSDLRTLPSTEPRFDPIGLLVLQEELLSWAEHLYGPRDKSFQLYLPQFHDDGPNVRFTLDGRGAYAELAPKGKRHLRFAVFQLAHETVHLLDQVFRARLGTSKTGSGGVFAPCSAAVRDQYCDK